MSTSSANINAVGLRRQLEDFFSIDDLQLICFELQIEFENIKGDGKTAKTIALVDYCQKRGILPRLLEKCRELRPQLNVEWGLSRDKNSEPQPLLWVEWLHSPILEQKTISSGSESIRDPITPRSNVRLALRNASRQPTNRLTVILTGNANTFVVNSEFFMGPADWLDNYSNNTVVWKSTPGTILDGVPEGFEYLNQALTATTLYLGSVHWERDQGLYWLSITIVLEGIPRPANFELSLEPHSFTMQQQA